jgi:hypothetical protein
MVCVVDTSVGVGCTVLSAPSKQAESKVLNKIMIVIDRFELKRIFEPQLINLLRDT